MSMLFWAVAFFYLMVMFGAVIISIFKHDDSQKGKETPSIISVYEYVQME